MAAANAAAGVGAAAGLTWVAAGAGAGAVVEAGSRFFGAMAISVEVCWDGRGEKAWLNDFHGESQIDKMEGVESVVVWDTTAPTDPACDWLNWQPLNPGGSA
jgi:hypothetical protein